MSRKSHELRQTFAEILREVPEAPAVPERMRVMHPVAQEDAFEDYDGVVWHR